MRIRKLELHGFKSFPDRTTLHFGSGIACVVGPNGCGKSNIVDAIKWCVGEQSAKSLRGDDMLDVIFAGSAERAAVPYAEVTLTFSTEGGEPLPGEYARFTEVSIGRRLHRNGTSEYLINHARVRRKDVVELFLDTGVGNNLYSFIEQGRIGEIIHASPEKRRGLIDEAAGISRYKARRDEAQQELEATAGQLDRAADVTDEMARRVRVLEGQVVRAANFRRLRALIRQDEIFLGVVKYAGLVAERADSGDDLERTEAARDAAEEDVCEREDQLAGWRVDVDAAEQAANATRDELAELEARFRELEGARGFATRTTAEADDELRRIAEDLIRTEREAADAATSTDSLAAERETVRASLSQAEIEASERDAERERAQEERRAARQDLEVAEKALAQASEAQAGERARRDAIDRQAAALPTQREKLRGTLDAARREHEGLGLKVEKLRASVEQRREALEGARVIVETAVERSAERARVEVEAREVLADVERRLDATRREGDAAVHEVMQGMDVHERGAREEIARLEREALEAQKALRVAHEARLEAERGTARRDIEASEKRVATWLQALEQREDQMLRALQERARTALAEAEAEVVREAESSETTLREGVARAEAEAVTSSRRAVDAAWAEREAARAAEQMARAALVDHEQQVAGAAGRREALLGRKRGLDASLRDDEAREKGPAAVRSALPNAKPLVERLDLAEEDESWVAAVLDERLLAPVVEEAEEVLSAAQIAADSGRATLLWSRNPTLEGMLSGVAVVDTLADALDHHRRSGSAAVVRATGERVESDGLVRLGRSGGSAEAALRRRRELAKVQRELDAVDAEVAALRAVDAERRAAVTESTARRAASEKAVDVAEALGREQVRLAVDQQRQALQRTASERSSELRQRRDRLRLELETEASTARSASSTARASAQRELREVMQAIRDAADRAVEALRVALGGEVDAARVAAEQRLAEARGRWGAASDQSRSNLDAIRRDAAIKVESMSAEVAVARLTAEDARKARERVEAEATAARSEVFAAEVAFARAEADVQAAIGAEDRLAARIVEVEQQLTALDEEERTLREALVASIAILGERQAARESAAAEVATKQAASAATEQREEEARQRSADAQLRVTSLTERVRGIDAASTAARRRADEAHARANAVLERRAQVEQARGESTANEARLLQEHAEVTSRRDAVQTRLVQERERLSALRKQVRDAEAVLRERMEARDTLARRQSELEIAVQRSEDELRNLAARIDERYQVGLAQVLHTIDESGVYVLDAPDGARDGYVFGDDRVDPVAPLEVRLESFEDAADIRRRVAALEENRQDLAALGEVNLAAIEEYEDIAGRYRDLVAQRADLEASVESIRSAIAKMNRTCRQRFRDAFDRVNENFQAAYPRLVGGGAARLSLTQEEDLLEAGVEIFVQPPGKRLQNLTLLSGGEKAMAAIALLLSLFQVKPSPFCLLDEVDAPLDEANGARFNDMLREMSGMSQFIVITHNRKTMEVADTLYGITMPTPGCSTLVSVRLGV